MTDEEPPRPSGLSAGSIAPLFEAVDVYGKNMDLIKLLETFNGVLIDFFRGNW
jgi:hypothetical protein